MRDLLVTILFRLCGDADHTELAPHLILRLFASCEPLNKLRQARREGGLDWTVRNPQSVSQPLKVIGG